MDASHSIGPISERPITFNQDILPILQKRCQSCHRPGEVAPMSLLNYAEARPWAKAIKAAVATLTMPPWFADPNYGHFLNDPRLSSSEIAKIVSWAEHGAPEGKRRNIPPPLVFQNGWNIKPDIVVQLPNPIALPATGQINYKWVLVRTSFPENMWIEAAEVRPENARVLHHAKVWVRPPASHWMERAIPGEVYEDETPSATIGRNRLSEGNDVLGKFNPGLGAQRFDMESAAKFVPKGSDLVFELHYTPIGQPATDSPKLGLVLAKHPPTKRYLFSMGPAAYNLDIPPKEPNFEVVSEATVGADIKIAQVQPHMHLRGKDYELRVIYPNGESQTVFKGKFDFTWQLGYDFVQPLALPRGTRIVGISHFDNSANNKFNPDPSKQVRWGAQNWNEMSNGFLGLIVDVGTNPETVLRPSGPSRPPLGLWWLLLGRHQR